MINKNIFKSIKGDLFGGLTAGIVALPLALAFGVQSGLGAAAGLYGAFIIGILAAIFGGTPTQISGPTAPMTVISALLVAKIVTDYNGNIEEALPAILFIFALAGLLQIVLGLLGIGKYVKYIPYPVVSGFMTGIGVIILITQIFPLFGYVPAKDMDLVSKFKPHAEEVLLGEILKEEAGENILVLEDFEETVRRAKGISSFDIDLEAMALAKKDSIGVIGSLRYMGRAMQKINWLEFLLALATILIIYGFKKVTTKVPSTLVALLVVSVVAIVMSWEVQQIRDIGEIPSGFPAFHLDIFTSFQLTGVLPYILTALTLAALGAIDSLLTSVVADNRTKTKHNSNKELIGQGIGNTFAAFFGGIPGAGATIRTVVNIDSGGKTALSGVIHGIILLLILLILGPYASSIPLAVLAGILITVGIGVMDYRGLRALRSMPRTDAVVMLVVLVLTVFVDLIQAVAIGMILSSLIFMKKMGEVNSEQTKIGRLKDLDHQVWEDEVNFPEELKEEVYIKHMSGPLFFGYTNEFTQLATKIPITAKLVILRMGRVPYMDQSGLYALEEVVVSLKNRGVEVLITGLRKQPKKLVDTIDLIPNIVPEEQLFLKFVEAVNWIREKGQRVL